jgi:NTP pyrophosphatase (non-canonical NTP hydrolase)
MMPQVDLAAYSKFVAAVTSEASRDLTTFMNRLDVLDGNYDFANNQHGPDVNVPLMLTGVMGLCSESGELMEIVKKITFQGKPLNEDNLFHMKRELGDIMWYWINMCRALNLDPNAVIAENVEKLKSRYPGGEFDVYHSENRQQGDL